MSLLTDTHDYETWLRRVSARDLLSLREEAW
jgi:hypothetical protein